VKQFRVLSQSTAVQGGFEALYAQTVDKVLRGTGTETFEAIEMLRKADPSRFQPENGATYPNGRVGQTLQQVAQLVKSDIGMEVSFVDTGGWDNHVNEGGAQGQMSNLLRDMGQGLAALHQDLGDRMEDIVVVTMSEFGRTAHENGNRGTDHGHANVMFVMGGPVKGGKVYGKWPGLAPEQLNEGRDLKLTTDFRSVLGEVIGGHLGSKNLKTVFPGFDNNPANYPHLLKA
jgi:uncharacterized protein (DUF1501 family)